MKRLAVCLQRIGDVLVIAPILRSIKLLNPKDELHILIHRDCEAVSTCLDGVDQIHYFERRKWQESLGELSLSGLEGYSGLQELIKELRTRSFDHVFNLSHNRIGAWLTGLLSNTNFSGVRLERMGHAQFSSVWFEDLDRLESHKHWETFNVFDYMRMGCGLTRLPTFEVNESNRRSYRTVTKSQSLAVQLFTSDAKKNFPLKSWQEFLTEFMSLRSDVEIKILAAPFERSAAEDWLKQLPLKISQRCQLLADSLDSTAEILEQTSLLVTGDTSIKHLSALVGTPVLEIALGSSDVNLNGVYREGNVIVRSRARCFPCAPREACSQIEHFCSRDIDPAVVAMLATQMIDGMLTQVRPIAEEYRSQIEILRTVRTHDGLWHAIPFAERFGKRNVEDWVLRCFKATQMTNWKRDNLVSYAQMLRTLFPYASVMDWSQVFNDLVFPKDKEFIKKELIQCLKHSN